MIEGRLWDLTRKVYDEITSDPLQLLNKERRAVLWANGLRRLRSIPLLGHADLDVAISEMKKDLWWQKKNELNAAIYKANLAGIILPKYAKAHYYPSFDQDDFIDPLLFVTGPTIISGKTLPSEGYKRYDKLFVPFKDFNYEGKVPTSAFQIDNDQKSFEILSPEQRASAVQQELGLREYIVGGVFYMDSVSCLDLVKLSTMKEPQVHNGIGTFALPDGTNQHFTVNSASLSLRSINKSFKMEGKVAETEVTLSQVVALTILMAHKVGAVSWNYLGLEFRGGGSFLPAHTPKHVISHIIAFHK